MFATLVRKIYCMEGPMDCLSSTTDAKANRGPRGFERETKATLVEIPGSQRTNPNDGVQGFWLWASIKYDLNLKITAIKWKISVSLVHHSKLE